MKTFRDNKGKRFHLLRKDINLGVKKLYGNFQTIGDAIQLAADSFHMGGYTPHREATPWDISRLLHFMNLSVEASIFAADEGYKIYIEREKISDEHYRKFWENKK